MIGTMRTGQTRGDRRERIPMQLDLMLPLIQRHEVLERTVEEHVFSEKCWCFPRLEYVDPDTGVEVWVHHEPH